MLALHICTVYSLTSQILFMDSNVNRFSSASLCLTLCLLCGQFITESNAANRNGSYKASEIDKILNNLQKYGAVGSVAGYSDRSGKLTLQSSGFIARDKKVSMTQERLFQVGSQTKMFTAGAVLLLAKDKKISLSDKVQRYLPDFLGYPPITIKQLLTHTSGIGDSINIFDSPNQPPNFEISFKDQLMLGRSYGEQFIAGEKWEYNNLGFVLLGKIVERVSGKKFNTFIRERILDPLAMRNTFVGNLEKWPAEKMVTGYHLGRNEKLIDDSNPELSWASYAGDMVSNTEDMHKWFRALTSENNNINLYLSDFMQHSVLTESPGQLEKYGLGIMMRNMDGTEMWGHGGFIHGYISLTLVEPKTKNIVSIMVNVDDDSDDLFVSLGTAISLIYHLNVMDSKQ